MTFGSEDCLASLDDAETTKSVGHSMRTLLDLLKPRTSPPKGKFPRWSADNSERGERFGGWWKGDGRELRSKLVQSLTRPGPLERLIHNTLWSQRGQKEPKTLTPEGILRKLQANVPRPG
jgi:hypothetical protein